MSRLLGGFLGEAKRQVGVDEAAILAGAVGQAGVAALLAAHIVGRPQGVVRAAFALAGLADSLDRLHDLGSGYGWLAKKQRRVIARRFDRRGTL